MTSPACGARNYVLYALTIQGVCLTNTSQA